MDLIYTKDYIVEETSAAPILDDTERSGIAADHRNMVKFADRDSPGFRTVIAALRRYAQDAPGVVKVRIAEARRMLNEQDWQKAAELARGSIQGIQGIQGREPELSIDGRETALRGERLLQT